MSKSTAPCRLCLQDIADGVDLFAMGDNTKSYSHQLKDSLQIKLVVRKPYPTMACLACIQTLNRLVNEVEEFRTKVLSNQKELKIKLSTIKIESEEPQSTAIDDSKEGLVNCLTPEVILNIKEEPNTFVATTRKRGRPSTRTNYNLKDPLPIKKKKIKLETDEEKQLRLAAQRAKIEERKKANEEKIPLQEMLRTRNLLHCSECQLEVPSFYKLSRHMSTVHKRNAAFIVCCGRKYRNETLALDHMKYHLDSNAFKCDECGNTYSTNHGLRAHKRNAHLHPDDANFFCEICGKAFLQEGKRNEHLKSHLPPEEREFPCDQCEKRFVTAIQLNNHVDVVHNKNLSHICEFCGKGYSTANVLLTHIKTHEEKTMEQCNECGKFFFDAKKHALNVHAKKRVICKICGKDFNQRYMPKHIKNFHPKDGKCSKECSICGKVIRLAFFKEHMNLHTGIRRPCYFCPGSATSSANLIKHMHLKHPQEYKELKAKRNTEKQTKNERFTRTLDDGVGMKAV